MSWTELFPPTPIFTEKDIPDQHGRVFIVTGANSGIGYEVAKALYNLNGRVYLAARSAEKVESAIKQIKADSPPPEQVVKAGKGELSFLKLDLSDLTTIKASAEEFLEQEQRLDVVWHNAGVMGPPEGSITKQGHELTFGTNVLGPQLFQHFLTPLCLKTAKIPGVKPNATRVIFVSSNAHRFSPVPDGIKWGDFDLKGETGFKANGTRYAQSKAMNILQAHEFAKRFGPEGLVSLSVHPGGLKTKLQDNMPWLYNAALGWLRHPPRMGALTELYAGLYEGGGIDLKLVEDGGANGAHVIPWGRIGEIAPNVQDGLSKGNTSQRLWSKLEELLTEFTKAGLD
jgi:retinol dehydrogenase-12